MCRPSKPSRSYIYIYIYGNKNEHQRFAALTKGERVVDFLQEISLFPPSVRFVAVLGVEWNNRWP